MYPELKFHYIRDEFARISRYLYALATALPLALGLGGGSWESIGGVISFRQHA